ncbi:hypothetical protein HYW21_07430 [Candidatus Woesearchaeota archaeon]|nr:hypothetical protein [Candidatus Woesearchaeota archaeon]
MSNHRFVGIIATGSYLPQRLSNEDFFLKSPFLQRYGTDFPKRNLGIEKRCIATKSEDTFTMACEAMSNALSRLPESERKIGEIWYLSNIVPGLKQGHLYDMAQRLQHQFRENGHNENEYNYEDHVGPCARSIKLLENAKKRISGGYEDLISIIVSADNSRYTDPEKIESVIFGDGSSCLMVKMQDSTAQAPLGLRILNFYSQGISEYWDVASLVQSSSGDFVIEHAAKKIGDFIPKAIRDGLEGLVKVNDCLDSIEQIDLIIPHQANWVKICQACSALGIDINQVYNNLSQNGNLGAASIFAALDSAIRDRTIKSTTKYIALLGFGSDGIYCCLLENLDAYK